MRHFFIIGRKETEHNMAVKDSIISYIAERGGTCGYVKNPDSPLGGGTDPAGPGMDPATLGRDFEVTPHIDIPGEVEAIFTLGGDGTMVRAAQNTIGLDIPMAGINLGHLGYLCDLDENTVYEAIDQLMADNYQVGKRMMLEGSVYADDKQILRSVPALNDIVISYVGQLNMINISIYVDKKYLYSYNCDGMIFSTPTGSTAYNLSANGPIVDPKTQLILITPINPHTLNSRSVIIDAASEVELRVASRYEDSHVCAEVRFDGNQKIVISEAERLVVRRASATTGILEFTNMNFMERLSRKLQER